MTCPHCTRAIGKTDGVYVTWRHGERIVFHSKCHARAPFVEPSPDDEALVEAIASMLHSRMMVVAGSLAANGPDKLAREISQVLLSRFRIERR